MLPQRAAQELISAVDFSKADTQADKKRKRRNTKFPPLSLVEIRRSARKGGSPLTIHSREAVGVSVYRDNYPSLFFVSLHALQSTP